MNILSEVQTYVADKLNNDPQLSGLCPFLVETKKEIEYEIKNKLGRQGLVGVVMTPKATYQGKYEDLFLAWTLEELEIDVIENVIVNRGKKDGYITGQDAAMKVFDVLCPLSGPNEGQFNPVSYQEGEDGGLIVNKCVLKALVYGEAGPGPGPGPTPHIGMHFVKLLDEPPPEGVQRQDGWMWQTEDGFVLWKDGEAHQLVEDIPSPSDATPKMDSASGSPGLSSEYSRADHQHPSDSSKLSLAGGTMTGLVNKFTALLKAGNTENYARFIVGSPLTQRWMTFGHESDRFGFYTNYAENQRFYALPDDAQQLVGQNQLSALSAGLADSYLPAEKASASGQYYTVNKNLEVVDPISQAEEPSLTLVKNSGGEILRMASVGDDAEYSASLGIDSSGRAVLSSGEYGEFTGAIAFPKKSGTVALAEDLSGFATQEWVEENYSPLLLTHYYPAGNVSSFSQVTQGLEYGFYEDSKTAWLSALPEQVPDSIVLPWKVRKDGEDYVVTAIGTNIYSRSNPRANLTSFIAPTTVLSVQSTANYDIASFSEVVNPALRRLELPGVTQLSGYIPGSDLSSLDEYDFRSLSACLATGSSGGFLLVNTGVNSLRMPALRYLYVAANGININQVEEIDAPELLSVNILGLAASNAGARNLRRIYAPRLSAANNMLDSMPMAYAEFPQLQTVGSLLRNMPYLAEARLPSLKSASGTLFSNCPALAEVNLPSLEEVTGSNCMLSCTSLRKIKAPNLKKVTGSSGFQHLSSLEELQVSQNGLSATGGSFLAYCPGLNSSMVRNIAAVGANAFRESFGNTDHAEFDSLLSCAGNATLQGCNTLKSVRMPRLLDFRSEALSGCTSLVTFDAPALSSIQLRFARGCVDLVWANLSSIASTGANFLHQCTPDQVEIFTATSSWTAGTFNVLPKEFHLLQDHTLNGVSFPAQSISLGGRTIPIRWVTLPDVLLSKETISEAVFSTGGRVCVVLPPECDTWAAIEVDNTAATVDDAYVELVGKDVYYTLMLPSGQSLQDVVSVSPGTIAEFKFIRFPIDVSGKQAWKLERTDLVIT